MTYNHEHKQPSIKLDNDKDDNNAFPLSSSSLDSLNHGELVHKELQARHTKIPDKLVYYYLCFTYFSSFILVFISATNNSVLGSGTIPFDVISWK